MAEGRSVKRAIVNHWKDFAAVFALFLVSLGVGGYILSNQRLYLPHWVPIVGSDFVDRKFEMVTGQALTPGQGQEIDIAGVKVGEIAKVELKDGLALVTVKMRRRFADRVYKNATTLVRPKTGLNDMTFQLDPGTPAAGKAPHSYVIPVNQTLPTINADEVLSSLDRDTRDYLRMLLAAGGEGLNQNSRELSNTFRRFAPTNRYLRRITSLLVERRQNIRRSIHNFKLLTQSVGEKDDQLAQLIDNSNVVFQAFAREDANLRETLRLLPPTLQTTRTSLTKAGNLARELGPAATALRPFARALGPSLRATRPFLRQSTPIIRDQIRPFVRASLPTVKVLRPAARNLAQLTPDLTRSFKVLNALFNTLAYNPPGNEEGYLFWTSWANHAGSSVFEAQDAHGPIRHGTFLVSCSTLTTLTALTQGNPALGTIIQLVNPVTKSEVCPGQAGAGSGTPPGGGTG
jgi:phospholipid/cholesterol/gamma-HCH transport system substrate-binding protein